MDKLHIILLLIFPVFLFADQNKVSVNGFEIPSQWYQAYYEEFLHYSEEYKDWLKPDPGCTPVNDELLRDTVIKFVLIEQEARKRGLKLDESDKERVEEILAEIKDLSPQSDPKSRAHLEVKRMNLLNSAFIRQLVPEATREEIQKEYDRMLLTDDPLVVDVPFVKVRSLTLDTKEEATKVFSEIEKGDSFDDFASKLDPHYELAKDLAKEWIPASKAEEVEAVIETAKAGDTIGPYRSMYGWSLQYIDDMKIIPEVPLDQKTHRYYSYLKGKIRTRLHFNKLENLYLEIRTNADVRMNGKPLAVPDVLFYRCNL